MPWMKQGLIFKPNGEGGWMISHAQLPTVLVRTDTLRVYFSSRNSDGKSLVTFLDADMENPSKILHLHKEPILQLGRPGTFDEDGIMPGCIVEHDDKLLFYYIGWSRGVTIPYRNAVGLAVSLDGGTTFTRMFEGPIVDRTPNQPYTAMSPFVMKQQDHWHMWYASGTDWVEVNGKYEPIYIIKYAESQDGIAWKQPNVTCIAPNDLFEANTRPTVIKDGRVFRMWYCYRGSHDYRDGTASYRIGYAESSNPRDWQRKDALVGIQPSVQGWDSKMLAYPYVVKTGEKLLMFYNGNGFGRSGMGYAVWKNTI